MSETYKGAARLGSGIRERGLSGILERRWEDEPDRFILCHSKKTKQAISGQNLHGNKQDWNTARKVPSSASTRTIL